jgi:hypothetical protein
MTPPHSVIISGGAFKPGDSREEDGYMWLAGPNGEWTVYERLQDNGVRQVLDSYGNAKRYRVTGLMLEEVPL